MRSIIEYEVDDVHQELEAMVSMAALAATAEKFSEHAKENKAPQATYWKKSQGLSLCSSWGMNELKFLRVYFLLRFK